MQNLTKSEFMALIKGAKLIEKDPHGPKVYELPDTSIVKLFRRKRWFSSTLVYPYARRFADNARRLAERGIPVPVVLAVARVKEIARDIVHYRALEGKTLMEIARAGTSPDELQYLRQKFTAFIISLHESGIYFRSLHLGNVVLTPQGDLGLIDFLDLRIFPWRLDKRRRARNLELMQSKGFDAWFDCQAIVSGKQKI